MKLKNKTNNIMFNIKNNSLDILMIVVFFLLSIIFGVLTLKDSNSEEYHWKVLSVVDGDTIKVSIPNLPEELKTSVRVKGIDTPEKKAKTCPQENAKGYEATYFTMGLIDESHDIIFKNISWDKYGGRILADVYINGENLAEKLIKADLAREYHGEKKKGWCDGGQVNN